MAYKIIVTNNAEHDIEEIVTFLRTVWSRKTAEEFSLILISKIELLTILPFLGKPSEKDVTVRRIIITKQNSLYYKIQQDNIVILNLLDNRKNPASNPYS